MSWSYLIRVAVPALTLLSLIGGCDPWPTDHRTLSGAPNPGGDLSTVDLRNDLGFPTPSFDLASNDLASVDLASNDLAGVDPIVGCYSWFNGGIVQVFATGALAHSAPADTGSWYKTGFGNTYHFTWSSGAWDNLTLSGGTLSGPNSGGGTSSGIATKCP